MWGDMRASVHAPSTQSWQHIATILCMKHPDHEALCAYALAQLDRWPCEVLRPVPDVVLAGVLQGRDPPEWAWRGSNAFHLVRRTSSYAPFQVEGLFTVRGGARADELLDAFAGQQWQSMVIENVMFTDTQLTSLVTHLDAQEDLRMLALARNGFGRHALERVWGSDGLSQLEHLTLDGNMSGKRAARLVLSEERWSERRLRTFSWRDAQLRPNSFERLSKTPWFGEVERLDLLGNPYGGALEGWGARMGMSLESFGLTWDVWQGELAPLWSLKMCAGLKHLALSCVSSGLMWRGRELSMSPRVFLPMLDESAVWSDSLESLELHVRGGLESVSTLMAEDSVWPETFHTLRLCVDSPDHVKALVTQHWSVRHPGVSFHINDESWRDGVWVTAG